MQLPSPPRHPKRLVYLGTPDVGVEPLQRLHGAGFDITLVVSRPDKRRGRGKTLTPSPVKAAALELGLTVSDGLDDVAGVGADLGVVVAYGRIIPTALLADLPMLNLHFSQLPRWRGAAPVERAILAGDERTGVCLMAVAPELDTGDVYRCDEVAIDPEESLDELRGRLVTIGAEMLVEEFSRGLGEPEPQTGEVTYANKIEADDNRLDFTQPAVTVHRVTRLGRAWCLFRNKRLKILVATMGQPREDASLLEAGQLCDGYVGCGDGPLRLIEVQPEGKKPMVADAWLNGVQPQPGERLG